MRANIYSLEPLAPAAREAVHDGIGMVAAYMGEPIATNELQVRLPLTPDGCVDPRRVGFAHFDMMVELHLIAVPLQGSAERPGIADVARGVSFTDVSSDAKPLIRTVTAHEVAHSLGFVLADSTHVDASSEHHCAGEGCIMHRRVVTDTQTLITLPKTRLADRLRGRKAAPLQESVVRLVNGQYDFCGDCKTDLYHNGLAALNKLRWNRLFHTKKV